MTLEQLQTRLNAYLQAETAILTGSQEYTVRPGDGTERRVRRADLSEIRVEISRLNNEIARLGNTGRRVFYVRG
jgi:hypothetical protein